MLNSWFTERHATIYIFLSIIFYIFSGDINRVIPVMEKIILENGTFKADDFGWVSTAKIILEKIRNGSIKDFS